MEFQRFLIEKIKSFTKKSEMNRSEFIKEM